MHRPQDGPGFEKPYNPVPPPPPQSGPNLIFMWVLLNVQIGPMTLQILGNNAAIINKISVLSGSIILYFVSKLEAQSLPMKLIVVPDSPFYN